MVKHLRDLIKKNVMTPGQQFTQIDREGITNYNGKLTKKFTSIHTVDRVDAPYNGDDVFKATNIKQAPYKRAHAGDGVSESLVDKVVSRLEDVNQDLTDTYYQRNPLDAENDLVMEISKKKLDYYISKTKFDFKREKGRNLALKKKWGNPKYGLASAKVPATEETQNEHLSASMGAGKYIDDFVHSKNSRFDGKSKAKRIQMALGAYYGAKKNEETINEHYPVEVNTLGAQTHVDKAREHLSQHQDKKYAAEGFWAKAQQAHDAKDKRLADMYADLASHCQTMANAHLATAHEHLRKHLKEEEGLDDNMITEEVLDEISKDLARRYAIKSATQQVKLNSRSMILGNDYEGAKKHKRELDKIDKKFAKRDKGLRMANKRLPGGHVEPRF